MMIMRGEFTLSALEYKFLLWHFEFPIEHQSIRKEITVRHPLIKYH